MANIFINATQARKNTRDNSVIHNEIRILEGAVLASVDAGELSATVSTGTDVTDNDIYYKAYYGITEDRTLLDQLDYITQYFTNLGYSIKIKENTSTGNTLIWDISW